MAVTSGSQFAAYPVGSAAATSVYQQAGGAPGGAIMGPIIALGKINFSIFTYFRELMKNEARGLAISPIIDIRG